MKIEKRYYKSFNDFFVDTLPTGDLGKNLFGFIYRGESTNKYLLVPSALRLENKNKLFRNNRPIEAQSDWEYFYIYAEYDLLRDFYKISNSSGLKVPYVKSIRNNYVNIFPMENILKIQKKYKWISEDVVELAALAQHYGTLTRLLDWTYDLYTALYFASIGAMKRMCKNGSSQESCDSIVVWALNAEYLSMGLDAIPLKFVVPSYYSNPNLNAQKGVLTYWEIMAEPWTHMMYNPAKKIDRTPLDKLLSLHCNNTTNPDIVLLYKFEFPVSDCVDCFKGINRLGYTASKLFPGYGGVTRELDELFLLNELQR